MTRITLLLVACLWCSTLHADEPKKVATVLEGVWQEPLRPGEQATVRWKFVFAGETVTIHFGEQVLKGKFQFGYSEKDRTAQSRITLNITSVEGKGTFTQGTYSGQCLLTDGQLHMRIKPHPAEVSDARRLTPEVRNDFERAVLTQRRGLGLAPVPMALVSLEKAKK